MTLESRSRRQRYRMRREVTEEALRRRDQDLDAAGEAVCGDLVFHEAPDTLGRVIVVAGVLGQPQELDARVGCEPLRDSLGGVGGCAVEHQGERPGRVDGREALPEGDEMDGQLAVMIGPAEDAR